jgi:hypothetical protein
MTITDGTRSSPVLTKRTPCPSIPGISRSLCSFIDANHPEMALVLNRALSHNEQINGTEVIFLPFFAL